VGGEVNAIVKDWDRVRLHFALAFPDLYTIGMSNLGIQILYDLINRRDDCLAERVFTPAVDLEARLRAGGVPLLSLENMQPLAAFDVVGFSVHTELAYTNILTMLDLGGIPRRAADRGPGTPLVCCGGHNINYEPVADFFDFIFIGEAEEAIGAILDAVIAGAGEPRAAVLDRLEGIEGIYIPSRFEPAYAADGRLTAVTPRGRRATVTRRIVADLDAAPYPVRPVIPNVEVVHDRISVELMRGCPNACRYCMSGNFTRRVRTRRPETVMRLCREAYANTGYDEISLLSLSTGDYPGILDLLRDLSTEFAPRQVGISLPSLSVTHHILTMLPDLKAVRRVGLTFAPETGNEELRRLQHKATTDAELLDVIREAYRMGWDHIKLYFMVGLPGETPADVAAIADLVLRISDLRREVHNRPGGVNLTISPFVPKPFTPFQWEPMCPPAELEDRIQTITGALKRKTIRYKYPDIGMTVLEGVFARGDRRLAGVIEAAWAAGARFDSWSEHARPAAWEGAFAAAGLDPAFYTTRARAADEVLPWAHILTGCEEHVRQDRVAFVEQLERRRVNGD
jgi:radical SAM family uncharacterized protein